MKVTIRTDGYYHEFSDVAEIIITESEKIHMKTSEDGFFITREETTNEV